MTDEFVFARDPSQMPSSAEMASMVSQSRALHQQVRSAAYAIAGDNLDPLTVAMTIAMRAVCEIIADEVETVYAKDGEPVPAGYAPPAEALSMHLLALRVGVRNVMKGRQQPDKMAEFLREGRHS